MSEATRDVTAEYDEAEAASKLWVMGEQPDIEKLMRSAYMHGYAAALLKPQIFTDDDKFVPIPGHVSPAMP